MDSSLNVKLGMYAGEVLLRNGAEAFRVEDTMSRILKHYGYVCVDTITTTTGMYVCVVDKNGNATTLVKRIHDRTINLNNIAEVNSISRKICEDKISASDAYDELIKLYNTVTYPDYILILSWAFASFGFSYILNSSFQEAFATLFVGFISGTFAIKFCKNLSRIAYPCTVSAFTALISILVSIIFKNLIMDNIIVSGIMPLVPGVASVNAIRDLLNGDYMSAQTRLLDVIVVAICIALGVGFSLGIYVYLGELLWMF